jgi:hypothetical protein
MGIDKEQSGGQRGLLAPLLRNQRRRRCQGLAGHVVAEEVLGDEDSRGDAAVRGVAEFDA